MQVNRFVQRPGPVVRIGLMAALSALSLLLSGCIDQTPMELERDRGEREGAIAAAAATPDDPPTDPCIEVAMEYIDMIEGMSSWRFNRNRLDTGHAEFCEIVDGIVDALYKAIEEDPDLLTDNITYEVEDKIVPGKNAETKNVWVSADGTVTATIAFYRRQG